MVDDNSAQHSRRQFLKLGAGGVAGAALVAGAGAANAAEGTAFDATKQVVVLGSGAAGLAAAISAAENGKSVTLYERAPNPGGSSRRSGGVIYLGGGTSQQKVNGFEDTPERMYDYLSHAMGFGADLARIKAYCEGSVSLHQWLVDAGVQFNDKYSEIKAPMTVDDSTLYYSGSERSWPYNIDGDIPRGHKVAAPSAAGHALIDQLMAHAQTLDIEFVNNRRARSLITEAGAVVGVVIENTEDQTTQNIGAEAGVIVCTGGFQFNKELVTRHLPTFLRAAAPLGAPEEDGDALIMGQEVGADVRLLERGSPWRFIYPPEYLCKGLFINPRGQRFISEDIYGGNASDIMIRDYEGFGYLVIDQKVYDSLPENEVDLVNIEFTADTIGGLETEIGLPAGSLASTVGYYNTHAANGEDPLFHKKAKYVQPLETGPFHAIDVGSSAMVWITLGGLAADVNGQVLNARNEPIKGLYAAGRATSSLGGIYNSGTSLGDCLFFGRAAGAHIGA